MSALSSAELRDLQSLLVRKGSLTSEDDHDTGKDEIFDERESSSDED